MGSDEWVKRRRRRIRRRRRREWGEFVTRMDAEMLVKISMENTPAGGRSPGHPKRSWNDLIRD